MIYNFFFSFDFFLWFFEKWLSSSALINLKAGNKKPLSHVKHLKLIFLFVHMIFFEEENKRPEATCWEVFKNQGGWGTMFLTPLRSP